MNGVLYLAWRYLAYNRWKTTILVGSIMLIIYLPVGLNVVVKQSGQHLNARAQATPLLVGAKGSPLELSLNSLYFSLDTPELTTYAEATAIIETGLAEAIPMYVRFKSREQPIVATSFEYFGRALRGRIVEQVASWHRAGRINERCALKLAETPQDPSNNGLYVSTPPPVEDAPPFLKVWLMVIVDNIAHVIINALALYHLGGHVQ